MIKLKNDFRLSQNFLVSEFVCKCGCGAIIDVRGVQKLQQLRDYFKKPVMVNSAYRCEAYNKKIGGASKSKHMAGIAYDVSIIGVHPLKVAQYAIKLGFTGIGVYTHNGNMFTHVDMRETPTFWVDVQGSKNVRVVTTF